MKPALTSEEWGDTLLRVPTGEPVGYLRGAERVTDPSRCHQLAACCLHGQPFGFTREDVDDERAELVGLEGQLRGWLVRFPQQQLTERERENMARLHERIARKRSRIDRIEALLPPEAP